MQTECIALISAVVVALITTGSNLLINRLNHRDSKADERETQDKLVRQAVMVMLHDRLYQACHYYIRKGSVDESGYENVTELYDAYHSMGGNGTGTKLYQQVEQLWTEALTNGKP